MKGLIERLENMFAAATFAQAGEFEMAKYILGEKKRQQEVDRISSSSRPRKELRAPGIGR